MRFDPFQDLDRLAEQVRGQQQQQQRVRGFPLDAYRREQEFFLEFDLPGFAADDIDVTSEQNVLTVRAERRSEWRDDDEVIVNERPEGVFARQVFLGESLDLDAVEASYEQGVLTLRIPVRQAARPRRIEIGGAPAGAERVETGPASGE